MTVFSHDGVVAHATAQSTLARGNYDSGTASSELSVRGLDVPIGANEIAAASSVRRNADNCEESPAAQRPPSAER